MEKVFSAFVNFILDSTRTALSRLFVVFLVLFTLCVINNMTGFSYYYSNDKKLTQLERLIVISKDSSLDTNTKEYVKAMKNDILNRKNFVDYISLYLNEIYNEQSNPKIIAYKRSGWWQLISSGSVYFILAILAILIPITFANKSWEEKMSTVVTSFVGLAFAGLFMTWILSYIPKIFPETWFWNYVVNFIIQISIISVLLYKSYKKGKSTSKAEIL